MFNAISTIFSVFNSSSISNFVVVAFAFDDDDDDDFFIPTNFLFALIGQFQFHFFYCLELSLV